MTTRDEVLDALARHTRACANNDMAAAVAAYEEAVDMAWKERRRTKKETPVSAGVEITGRQRTSGQANQQEVNAPSTTSIADARDNFKRRAS